jgi:hypothetical protein
MREDGTGAEAVHALAADAAASKQSPAVPNRQLITEILATSRARDHPEDPTDSRPPRHGGLRVAATRYSASRPSVAKAVSLWVIQDLNLKPMD